MQHHKSDWLSPLWSIFVTFQSQPFEVCGRTNKDWYEAIIEVNQFLIVETFDCLSAECFIVSGFQRILTDAKYFENNRLMWKLEKSNMQGVYYKQYKIAL